MRLRTFLLPVLLLAGCRSERVAFDFASVNTPTTQAAAQPVASAEAVACPTPSVFATKAALATRVLDVAPRHRNAAVLLRPQRSLAVASPLRASRRPARGQDFLGNHPAERALLIGGASSTVLGLLSNYLALSATTSRTLLLNTGHFLLVLGSLLLLGWFILLLLRALKE